MEAQPRRGDKQADTGRVVQTRFVVLAETDDTPSHGTHPYRLHRASPAAPARITVAEEARGTAGGFSKSGGAEASPLPGTGGTPPRTRHGRMPCASRKNSPATVDDTYSTT